MQASSFCEYSGVRQLLAQVDVKYEHPCRCQHCQKTFVFKNSLKKHLEKGRCVVLKLQKRQKEQDQIQQHEVPSDDNNAT